jgi:hypothetical protein
MLALPGGLIVGGPVASSQITCSESKPIIKVVERERRDIHITVTRPPIHCANVPSKRLALEI